MDNTPNLDLPYIIGAQAQKHVTHNKALRVLDALVHLTVRERTMQNPPENPQNGERYIVASGGSGLWAGQDLNIAAFQDGEWIFYPPREGFLAWVSAEAIVLVWDGAAWVQAGGGATNPAPLVGVNTQADKTNRLSVKSDAILLSHDDVTPGSGDIRLSVNKAVPSGSASMIFQTGFSGRAEFGLTGNDNWSVRVSADGATFQDALIADNKTGLVSMPAGLKHAASGAMMSSFIQTPGGSGETTLWRFDVARTGTPRSAVISAVSGNLITLTTPVADQFFTNNTMENVSYLRLWNQSKTPEQSAWIMRRGTTSQLFVLRSADISSWREGEMIRLGEPGAAPFNQTVAVDISQMLQNRVGAIFRQTAMFVNMIVSVNGPGGILAQIGVTPTGAGGSFSSIYSGENGVGSSGGITSAGVLVPCSELSPISHSNLLFVREMDDRTASLRIGGITCAGVFV